MFNLKTTYSNILLSQRNFVAALNMYSNKYPERIKIIWRWVVGGINEHGSKKL